MPDHQAPPPVLPILLVLIGGMCTPASPALAAGDGGGTPSVVVLGDSLAAGYGVDPEQAFPALLGKRIAARGWEVRVVNAGVSGDTTAGGLRRLDWLLRQPIDVLVVELGGNDALRGTPLDAIETNLQAIVDRARAAKPHLEIVLAGMQAPPNLGPDYTDRFRDLYRRLAQRNHLHLVPFLLEGVGGRPELNLPDGIHPSPGGHRILADNVWAILEGVLEGLVAAGTG